jgi:hypothetical protein
MSQSDPWEPCPFCKSTDVAVHAQQPPRTQDGVWFKCRACGSIWFAVKR